MLRTLFTRRLTIVLVAMLACLTWLTTAAAAQARTGAVTGTVRDSAGHAVPHVQVSVIDAASNAFAISDDTGFFRLASVPGGTHRLVARHMGFAPDTAAVRIAIGRTSSANLVLHAAAVALESTRIVVDPLRGKMGPFNKRRARGIGTFITRQQIEARQAPSVSELLRYVTGVGITQEMAGVPQPIHMQRTGPQTRQSQCAVQLYVDGNPYPNGDVDDFEPGVLEGVEVYKSAAEIPADFRTRDATCGVIALWTRDPDAAHKRP